jgi:hypothetical protein
MTFAEMKKSFVKTQIDPRDHDCRPVIALIPELLWRKTATADPRDAHQTLASFLGIPPFD